MAEREQHRRNIAGLNQVVACPAVDHVLPDKHSKSVTMIIPAHRFYFAVLPYHVKSLCLGSLDVINHRLVAHGRQEAFGIIALV